MLRFDTTRRAGSILVVVGVLAGMLTLAGMPADAAPSTLATRYDVLTVQATTLAASSTASVDVLRNDTCLGRTPCPRTGLWSFTATGPAGWTVRPSATSGAIYVTVPPAWGTRTGLVRYTLRSQGHSATGTVYVHAKLPPTPRHYNPPAGSRFSHAFVRTMQNRIKRHVLLTVDSVPRGGQIRILSWSFSGKAFWTALRRAKARGVSVQVVLAGRNTRSNSDYARLRGFLGTNRAASSWVRRCHGSCRGTGGTMHAKVFLFSQAYNTKWVVMTGSANLTNFAASRQWNQLNTVTGSKAVYDGALSVFAQAMRDRPASPRQVTQRFGNVTFVYNPLNAARPANDDVLRTLNTVRCTSAWGRTRVRIAMYVWRDARGAWLARRVRALWNQGCDVRVIYAIMGRSVKKVLYNPSGRGRIPMRQVIQVNRDDEPVWYLHNKYVAISGTVGADTSANVVVQSSFNFSDFGIYSDENTQIIKGGGQFKAYNTDFLQIWRQKQSRAPSPISVAHVAERLGTGRYQYMEPD